MNFQWPWYRIIVPYALPSEDFPHKPGDYTWEQWRKDTKKSYPIPWFFQRSLPEFFRYRLWFPLRRPFLTLYGWLRFHIWARYHMLDLRNKTFDYKYGYVDAPQKMMYASFNILAEFVQKENGLYKLKMSIGQDPDRANAHKEAMELYNWWSYGRREEHHEEEILWQKLRTPDGKCLPASPERDAATQAWLSVSTKLELKDTEQLIRLMRIRDYLWA